jgi:hypothetical protein
MEGSSVEVWQEMQPEDLRSASSWDWPEKEVWGVWAEALETGDFVVIKRNVNEKNIAMEIRKTLRELEREDLADMGSSGAGPLRIRASNFECRGIRILRR